MRTRNAVRAAALLALAAAGTARAELIYATTLTGSLITLDSANPGAITSGVAIQGLASNEVVRGIDFRPATGQLYAVGSFGNLYTLNTATGQASLVAPLSTAISGSSFGVDFNPVADRLRVVSDTDQNLRINPATGATIVDGAIAYAAGDANFGQNPNAVHAAYTNSFAGAASTVLYVLDTGLDVLAIQNANAGTLTTVGAVGSDLTDLGGFDISGASGVAYAAVRGVQPDRTTLWTINLATGQGSLIGDIGGGSILTSIAVVPAPSTLGLVALGALAATRRRR